MQSYHNPAASWIVTTRGGGVRGKIPGEFGETRDQAVALYYAVRDGCTTTPTCSAAIRRP